MKAQPVRKYAQPKYPTRLEAAARPTLLQRHQPPAWRKWPELTGAAGIFLLADAARLQAAENPQKSAQNAGQTNAVAIVAPLFLHGEGRGATGCIVMSPPAFVSEEDALQIIREETAAKGLKLGTNQTAVAGLTFQRYKPGTGMVQEPFKARAADPEKKVYVEFLSQRHAMDWEFERGRETGKYQLSTVRQYDMPKTAAYVSERVKREATEKIYFGTFYDPLAAKWDFEKLRENRNPTREGLLKAMSAMTTESQRLLRLQVQDFLKWLEAQGAI